MKGVFDYKLKTEPENLAGIELRIESLANLNETIDQLFDALAKDGNPELLESLCPYFGVVWPSARALSEHMVLAPQAGRKLRNQSILEVGCGLAVPSLVCAKLGARVTATDFHPDIEEFLRRNIKLNDVEQVKFLNWDWQKAEAPLGLFDWVIGSDILYEKQHPAPVAKMLASHCKPWGQGKPGGHIVLADPGRPYLQAFVDEMKKLGFSCQVTSRTVQDRPTTKEVFVLDLTR